MKPTDLFKPLGLLHLSLIIIAAGGILTSIFAYNGDIYLRPGETVAAFSDREGKTHILPQSLRLISFSIETYPDSDMPRDYRSLVATAAGDTLDIRMNHIGRIQGYRFFQSSFDGYGGSLLLAAHDPLGTATVYVGFFLFAFSGAWLMLRKSWKRSLTLLCIVAMAWAIVASHYSGKQLLPVLASPWLPVHVSLVIVSYCLLGLTLPLSAAVLILPQKRPKLAKMAFSLILPGVYVLGLGIIAGSLWANISWGRYWGWDPKETWALITLLVYAFPLHRVSRMRRNPRRLSLYLIAASLSIAMTYFGVNFLHSLHAY